MLIHSKNGTVHSLSGIDENNTVYTSQFIATADYNTGDTFRNADTDEVYNLNNVGYIIPNLYFKTGDTVIVTIDIVDKLFGFKYMKSTPSTLMELQNIVEEILNGTQVVGDSDLLDGKDSTEFAPSGFGLGDSSSIITDWNDVIETGFYSSAIGALNTPQGAEASTRYFSGLHIYYNNSFKIQIVVIDLESSLMYVRRSEFGEWKPWQEIVSDTNILNYAAPTGFGLGDRAMAITDPNTLMETGFYRCGTSTTNMPNTNYFNILHMKWSDTLQTQYAIDRLGNSFTRSYYFSSEWSAWKTVISNENIDTYNKSYINGYGNHIYYGTGDTTSYRNFNNIPVNTIYAIAFSSSETQNGFNTPLGDHTGSSWYHVETIGSSSATRISQIVTQCYRINNNEGRRWIRVKHDTIWTPWEEIITTDNILAHAAPTGYGLGGECKLLASSLSWNTVKDTGFYMGNGLPDAPVANAWFMGYVLKHSDSHVIQTLYAFNTSSPKLYYRVCYNGAWNSWIQNDSGQQFGLGLGTNYVTDLNTLSVNGFYSASNTTVNSPVSGSYLHIIHHGDNGNPTQVAYQMGVSHPTRYMRTKSGNAWSAWFADPMASDGGIGIYLNTRSKTGINWDTLNKTGFYNVYNSPTNCPTNANTQYFVHVIAYSTDYVYQFAYSFTDASAPSYFRRRDTSGWDPWVRTLDTTAIYYGSATPATSAPNGSLWIN